MPGTPGWEELLITSKGDGAANTTGAAASMLPAQAKYTFGPSFWTEGKQLRIESSGRISSLITTPGTARYDIRFGGTVVFDGLAILLDTVAAHTTVGWRLNIVLTCRLSGSAGNFFGAGEWICEDILGVPATAPKGVLTAILPWNTTPTVGGNFDTTVSQQLDVFFTQTVATGSHTCHTYAAFSRNLPQ